MPGTVPDQYLQAFMIANPDEDLPSIEREGQYFVIQYDDLCVKITERDLLELAGVLRRRAA